MGEEAVRGPPAVEGVPPGGRSLQARPTPATVVGPALDRRPRSGDHDRTEPFLTRDPSAISILHVDVQVPAIRAAAGANVQRSGQRGLERRNFYKVATEWSGANLLPVAHGMFAG